MIFLPFNSNWQYAANLNLFRAFATEGYSAVQTVTQWNLDYTKHSEHGDRYSIYMDGFNRLMHRGPDWSGMYQHGDSFFAHQRLAIIDPISGDQPLYSEGKSIVVMVNGDIYNHKELRSCLPNQIYKVEPKTLQDASSLKDSVEQYGFELDWCYCWCCTLSGYFGGVE
ncbi:hypothetical protein ACFX2I_022839 [Malus domestica]